jgi:hypothetical protein
MLLAFHTLLFGSAINYSDGCNKQQVTKCADSIEQLMRAGCGAVGASMAANQGRTSVIVLTTRSARQKEVDL